MLKCIHCTIHRTLVQKTFLRTLRTSHALNIDTLPKKEPSPNEDNERIPNISDEFKTVFNFPYIRHFAVINRLKIYQTGITGLLTPGALVLNQLDYISMDLLNTVVAIGIAGCIPLYTLGYFTGNFIGYIYYNEKTDMARIAYADHWGRRKDIEMPANDIIPLADLPVNRFQNLWFTFRRYSTQETLKINTKYAIFVDREALKKII